MTNPSIASDLIERLLSEVVLHDDTGKTVTVDMGEGPIEVAYGGKTVMRRNPDGPEAVEALSRLTREVDELAETLEELAEAVANDANSEHGISGFLGARLTDARDVLGRVALSRSSGRVSDAE